MKEQVLLQNIDYDKLHIPILPCDHQ